MFDDEEQIVLCARRWYAAAKLNRDPILTHALEIQLAGAVVLFERGRNLKHLKPKTIRRLHSSPETKGNAS